MNEKQYIVTRIPEIDEDIQHYGVLGMKWGVRHDPANIRQDLYTYSTQYL